MLHRRSSILTPAFLPSTSIVCWNPLEHVHRAQRGGKGRAARGRGQERCCNSNAAASLASSLELLLQRAAQEERGSPLADGSRRVAVRAHEQQDFGRIHARLQRCVGLAAGALPEARRRLHLHAPHPPSVLTGRVEAHAKRQHCNTAMRRTQGAVAALQRLRRVRGNATS